MSSVNSFVHTQTHPRHGMDTTYLRRAGMAVEWCECTQAHCQVQHNGLRETLCISFETFIAHEVAHSPL